MSILGINTSTIPPKRDLPAGTYTFRIVYMKCRDDEENFIMSKPKEDGSPQRQLVNIGLQAIDEPTAEILHTRLMSNIEGDSEEFIANNEQQTADFVNCFKLDHELDLDELCASAPGNEGRATVTLQKDGPFAGSPQIGRFLVEG